MAGFVPCRRWKRSAKARVAPARGSEWGRYRRVVAPEREGGRHVGRVARMHSPNLHAVTPTLPEIDHYVAECHQPPKSARRLTRVCLYSGDLDVSHKINYLGSNVIDLNSCGHLRPLVYIACLRSCLFLILLNDYAILRFVGFRQNTFRWRTRHSNDRVFVKVVLVAEC